MLVERPVGTAFGSLVVAAEGGLVLQLPDGGRAGRLRKVADLKGGAEGFHVIDATGMVVATAVAGHRAGRVRGPTIASRTLAEAVLRSCRTGTAASSRTKSSSSRPSYLSGVLPTSLPPSYGQKRRKAA
jgi:hypothetical protein